MIGVVGSIVSLTILAFVVYFCMRYHRRKDAQQQRPRMLTFGPDGMDAYKQTSSVNGPSPINPSKKSVRPGSTGNDLGRENQPCATENELK